MNSVQTKEEYNADEVVLKLRTILKTLGIHKPCEETLLEIKKLIEKDGDNRVTNLEL